MTDLFFARPLCASISPLSRGGLVVMSPASSFSVQLKPFACAATQASAKSYPHYTNPNPSTSPNHFEGDHMHFTRTKNSQTLRADNDPNNSDERSADLIFIQEWARTKSAKEGAALTGMTPNGFKKVQAGECAISYEKLTFAMRRDPSLAAAYAAHVGLILPGEAEFAGALTQAFNAYQRRSP